MTHEPGPEHRRLAALVGRWRTEGWTRETQSSRRRGSRRGTPTSGCRVGSPCSTVSTPGWGIGHWEQLDDEKNWRLWMEITLTKADERAG
jgi:hypothetical protein